MPFYEYECQACKFYTEVMQKISEAPLSKCPSCGKRALKKLVSAPVFRLKGGGWYETDFKSEKEQKRNLSGVEKEEPKEEPKAEAKPAEGKAAEGKAGKTGEGAASAGKEAKAAGAAGASGKSAASAETGTRRAPARKARASRARRTRLRRR